MARRLLQAVAVVLAAYTLTFAVFSVLPADPVRIMMGPENTRDEAQVAALRAEYGLDRPVAERYADGVLGILRGDLGTSFQTGRDVGATIAEAAPRTFALAGAALSLAIPAGFLIAWTAAHTRRLWLRRLLAALPGLSLSVPTFWLGLMLLQAFSFGLPWFPARGGLVLPAVTLAVPSSAFVAQVLLERLTAEMRQPYVETARAKGASRARAVTAHALRNAAMPALTMAALLVGWLVSGSVVVETVFARNGLGRLIESAVATRDLPLLQGLVVAATAAVTLLTLTVDVAHPLVDPRLRERAA
ncbi:ABC transporter permease [Herbidospora yilanensis]|uniref:ABC transporter permease n=1 Tax=Herbidospora yilanensis TaxID=354426 RepID=UPI001E34D05A|nr:ABC transporter permease [Herbidospora yilanensis]